MIGLNLQDGPQRVVKAGTLRRAVRECLLLVFCRLQHEAWYEVRRVYRTRWYVWVLRDRTGEVIHSSGIGRHRTRTDAAAEAERFFGGV